MAQRFQGRVINCHSSKDWALAMKPDTERCIGRYAIPITPALKAKVTNVHLASFDHAAYWPQLQTVVQYTDLLQERRGMIRADQRSSEVRFAEEDDELFPALVQARPEELKFLAELMAQKRSASIDATVREPLKLAIELQRMGGDSFMNLARGHGVGYRQIAEDVAQRLGIKFDEPMETVVLADIEAQVAEKLIEQYKDKLSHADRQAFDAELKAAAQKGAGPVPSHRCRPFGRYGVERYGVGGADRVHPAARRGHGDSAGGPGTGGGDVAGERGACVFRPGVFDYDLGGTGDRGDPPAHGARSAEPGNGPGGASGGSV